MASASVPVYFEQSWSILSTVGMVNVIFGFTIVGITNLSPISVVPLVCSAATAIANGLCYYAFYADYSTIPTVVAASFADIFWLIQEAGLSFYSYIILIRVLKGKPRLVFMVIFWSLVVIIAALRTSILASRARNILSGSNSLQTLISRLHIGYFIAIASVEIVSAVFLLRKFAAAQKTSKEAAARSGLFSYLMRSTEIRLASLALIGITRAVTYSFQETAQSATNIASQVDRFVYTMECMFPVMMFIDILASKVVVTNHIHSSDQSRQYGAKSSSQRKSGKRSGHQGDIPMYSMSAIETRVEARNGTNKGGSSTSSQEHIIGQDAENRGDYGHMKGISRTVDFEVRETTVV